MTSFFLCGDSLAWQNKKKHFITSLLCASILSHSLLVHATILKEDEITSQSMIKKISPEGRVVLSSQHLQEIVDAKNPVLFHKISAILQDNFQQNPTLVGLDFSGVHWKKKALKNVLKPFHANGRILELTLDRARFTPNDIQTLNKFLPQSVRHLSLQDTNLSDFYFQGIAPSLSNLCTLNLSHNPLSNFILPALFKVITSSSHLQSLNLSYTFLDKGGVEGFQKAVSVAPQFMHLSLEGTSILQDPAYVELETLLKERSLRSSIVSVSDDGFIVLSSKKLQEAVQKRDPQIIKNIERAVQYTLYHQPNITGLDLSNVSWKKNVLKKILKFFQANNQILSLKLDHSHFTANDIQILGDFLPRSVQNLSLQKSDFTNFYFQGIAPSLLNLRTLNLSHNPISTLIIPTLTYLISTSLQLENIDLSYTSLDQDAAAELKKAVFISPKLMRLSLEGTKILQDIDYNVLETFLKERISGEASSSIVLQDLTAYDKKLPNPAKNQDEFQEKKISQEGIETPIQTVYSPVDWAALSEEDEEEVLPIKNSLEENSPSSQEDPESQFQRALSYEKGEEVPKDEGEALKWYLKAASKGYAQAQRKLGKMYLEGRGIVKDEKEAFKWFGKAAEQGDASAQSWLGKMYFEGEGIAKDEKEAFKWFGKAAEQGDASAQSWLGKMYFEGEGIAKDEKEAFKWFGKAAEQGSISAQSALGVLYRYGLGVTQSDQEAFKWYKQAADQRDREAQYYLGTMYAKGLGTSKNEEEAVQWYRKASEKGYAYAQYKLGVMYEMGRGVTQSDQEAFKWYKQATEQENIKAQNSLGKMYEKGAGVNKDEQEAVKWYRKAAEKGYAKAQYNLGRMYSEGKGVTQNEKEAMQWRLKAADQGRVEAQREIGYAYEIGKNIDPDLIKAFRWYLKAALQGDSWSEEQVSRTHRAVINTSLSAEKAKELYEECIQSTERSEKNLRVSQYLLGWFYETGTHISKNLREARSWYEISAAEGYREAQYKLGCMYLQEKGGVKKEKEGITWLEKSSNQGQEEAKYYLAGLFIEGKISSQAIENPLDLLRQGAIQGDSYSQFKLGDLCEKGGENRWYVTRDEEKAIEWYLKAAQQGNAEGLYKMGMMYKLGKINGNVNLTEAVKNFERAADQNNSEAQYELACMYKNGSGVVKNFPKSMELYRQAAGNGHVGAQRILRGGH